VPSASQATAADSVNAPPNPSIVWHARPVFTINVGNTDSPACRVSAGCPVQLSHHKAGGPTAFGLTKQSLALAADARARGPDVTVDVYPYTASSSSLAAMFRLGRDAAFEASPAIVASVNNTGPGLGVVGPSTTYEILEDFQTWICIFAMLLGRLEIFTLLVVLTPAFWRK